MKFLHTDDSPFFEDSKNIIFFSIETIISWERRPENLGKMGNNRDIFLCKSGGGVNFEREYWPLPPGIKILVVPQFFCMPDQILKKKK